MSAETKSGAEIGIQANLERRMGTMTQTSTGCQASPLQKSTVTYSVTPLSQRSENRFNFVDLGYDSLHSTPKQMMSTYADQSPKNDSPTVHTDEDLDLKQLSTTSTSPTITSSTRVSTKCCRRLYRWIPFKRTKQTNERTCAKRYAKATTGDDEFEMRHSVLVNQNSTTGSTTQQLDCLMTPTRTTNVGGEDTDSKTTPDETREEWGKKIDFLLSIIGFAVDLSNVWRFPYLCYKNGGGVFLIPYTTMLLFGALPLFFMELSLGQFAKSGPINLWDKICPPLKGIGYCFVLISWYVSFYYNVIIAWTTNYVIKTLTAGDLMPWQHCNNWYNTKECISIQQIQKLPCRTNLTLANDPNSLCAKLAYRTSPTEEFFNRGLLQIDQSRGLSSLGIIRPELVGCLIIVFIVLYFSLFKGVKSSGKVVWVTATAPYFILTILLARGLFLPGAISGIKYYINPRLEKLLEPMVWVDAAVQVFYSIGIGFGVHLTYASFNKFHNNCYRDCLITASVNSITSFYSGFVIFTYLGYMAHSMGKEIQNVAREGYGLVFQVYPEAISTLPFAKFWSLLFFVMLLTLGIDSAMGGLEAVITGIMDEFNLKWMKREYFTIIVISTSFMGALINCTQGGAFTMVWFDTYSAGISLLCSAMFEALAVTYFYGIEKFCLNIETMIGHRPSYYFVLSWKYISPLFLTTVIIMSIINSESITYYGYHFPLWATVSGWLFTFSSISAIPIYAFYYYFIKNRCTNKTIPSKQEVMMERKQMLDDTNKLNNAVYV